VLTAILMTVTVSGCNTPRGVPGGADLVTEATFMGSFQAPADGMLWIFRAPARGSRGQLHYSGPIGAGQVLVIDPATNRATIDGETLDIVLPGGDVRYQAYFKADSSVKRVLASRPAGRAPTSGPDYDFGAPLEMSAPARDTGSDVSSRPNGT
jgi:hypothetical protein